MPRQPFRHPHHLHHPPHPPHPHNRPHPPTSASLTAFDASSRHLHGGC